MTTLFYTFDGNDYANNASGRQELLEAISTALETEAWADPDLEDATDDERQEAASMSFDGTHYQAPFWQNIMAIMQHAPYEIDVKRVDSETATPDELERAEWLDAPEDENLPDY
jgi:hypothetical protein